LSLRVESETDFSPSFAFYFSWEFCFFDKGHQGHKDPSKKRWSTYENPVRDRIGRRSFLFSSSLIKNQGLAIEVLGWFSTRWAPPVGPVVLVVLLPCENSEVVSGPVVVVGVEKGAVPASHESVLLGPGAQEDALPVAGVHLGAPAVAAVAQGVLLGARGEAAQEGPPPRRQVPPPARLGTRRPLFPRRTPIPGFCRSTKRRGGGCVDGSCLFFAWVHV
jgi:hypothetical protein